MLALLSSVGLAVAQSTPSSSIAGQWALTLNSPNGTHPVTASIRDEGGTLVGTVSTPGGTLPLAVSTTDAGAVVMAFTVQYEGQPLPVTMTGKPTGDAIKGTVKYGGQAEGDFTGNRAAPTAAAAPAGSVAGTWAIRAVAPSGQTLESWSLTLTQAGTAVKGTLNNRESGAAIATSGTLTGSALSVKGTGEIQGAQTDIELSGTVDGDAIKGSYTAGGNTGSWTATRKP